MNEKVFWSRAPLWDVMIAIKDADTAIDSLVHEPNSIYRALQLDETKYMPEATKANDDYIDEFRFLGWDKTTYKIAELIDAVNNQTLTTLGIAKAKGEFPASYRPEKDRVKPDKKGNGLLGSLGAYS